MKCPKCGCERFMITAREIYHQDYFAKIEDDGSIETYSLGHGGCYNDPKFSNIATCCECEETVAIPGQLSDEEQNVIRQEAINKWEQKGLVINDTDTIDVGEYVYWVPTWVAVDKKED